MTRSTRLMVLASAAIVLMFILAVTAKAASKGYATWYDDGPGLYGAVHSWHYGDKPYPVKVCHERKCVTVIVRDFCACGYRNGKPTLIDLSPAAFRSLAPLSRGVITVTVGGTTVRPPATDTEPRWTWERPWTWYEQGAFWTSVLIAYVCTTRWFRRRMGE